MIHPNMATTLGYIFTDARISSKILKKLLKKNIETTFNAISCDGDTSTNDMVSIFATNEVTNSNIKNFKEILGLSLLTWHNLQFYMDQR